MTPPTSGSSIGNFRPDGSWDAESETPVVRDIYTSLYWFIDSLCTKRRRSPSVEPWEFAKRIRESPFALAFPNTVDANLNNLHRWNATILGREGKVPIPWFLASAETSAEWAIKSGGYQDSVEIRRLFEREVEERLDLPNDPAQVQALVDAIPTEVKV